MWPRDPGRTASSHRSTCARFPWRAGALAGIVCAAMAANAVQAEPGFRYSAPVDLKDTGSFVDLPLPPSVYARSQQEGLQDLRVVDAKGERVPFSLPAPRMQVAAVEQVRAVTLYPLPAQPAANGAWDAPVEVLVKGDTVRVTRLPGARMGGAANADAAHASAGWLFDLGERKPGERGADRLQLAWSGPTEFNAGYRLETSADLRSWIPAGGGQLMALASPTGALTQPLVMLSGIGVRFVRLIWLDPSTAPVVTGASARIDENRSVALDAPSAMQFAVSPQPVSANAAPDAQAAHALHFDLGGALPLQQIDLQFARGSRIVPARVQGRERLDAPWHDLGATVFYRVENGNAVSRAPPWPVQAHVRYLRIVVDERAGLPDAGAVTLWVTARLAHVVFVSQGQPPYAVLTGSTDAADGALPITTLVPDLEQERLRFAHATLGDWHEVTAVAQQAAAEQRRAERRPWLLWGVLLIGVLLLGAMVWRLASTRSVAPADVGGP